MAKVFFFPVFYVCSLKKFAKLMNGIISINVKKIIVLQLAGIDILQYILYLKPIDIPLSFAYYVYVLVVINLTMKHLHAMKLKRQRHCTK